MLFLQLSAREHFVMYFATLIDRPEITKKAPAEAGAKI